MIAKLIVPESLSYNGEWRISEQAVAQATAELGLKETVRISFTRGKRMVGCYRWKPDGYGGGWHSITVSRLFAEPRGASEALWHELQHARQTETLGPDESNYRYARLLSAHGYKDHPMEVEARLVSRKHEHLPLAVAL